MGNVSSSHESDPDKSFSSLTTTTTSTTKVTVAVASSESSLSSSESSLSSRSATATAAISAHRGNFKWMDGRKYHDVSNSSYMLSSDDKELDRIAMQHFVIKTLFQTNIMAPVDEILRQGGKVLDVGCSCGSWVMDVASEFPKSKIVGIDMLPLFPESIKPNNCTFTLANILDGLPFPDNTFDYVHMRFLIIALRAKEWLTVIAEVWRVCKVGGYCEFVEPELMPFQTGPTLTMFCEKVIKTSVARGQDPDFAKKLFSTIKSLDFQDVKGMFMSCPIGQWGGQVGENERECVVQALMSAKPLFLMAWGWTSDVFDERLAIAAMECREYEGFINYHRVYGQKILRESKE